MGVTLRRRIESGAKTPEVFSGVERPACPTVALAKVEGRALRPRVQPPGHRAAERRPLGICKGNYQPRPLFCRPAARRSPRGKPPGAAPSGGGGTPPWGELNGGVRFGECQSALPPPTLNKRVRGSGAASKRPRIGARYQHMCAAHQNARACDNPLRVPALRGERS